MSDLRYPIGPFKAHFKDHTTAEEKTALMDEIEGAPARLRAAVAGLDDTQLDTPYREDGWTVRQVVHHVADSHVNAYVRFRWALTEDGPMIKLVYLDEHIWEAVEQRWSEAIAEGLGDRPIDQLVRG